MLSLLAVEVESPPTPKSSIPKLDSWASKGWKVLPGAPDKLETGFSPKTSGPNICRRSRRSIGSANTVTFSRRFSDRVATNSLRTLTRCLASLEIQPLEVGYIKQLLPPRPCNFSVVAFSPCPFGELRFYKKRHTHIKGIECYLVILCSLEVEELFHASSEHD
jgi:hypothetical protein